MRVLDAGDLDGCLLSDGCGGVYVTCLNGGGDGRGGDGRVGFGFGVLVFGERLGDFVGVEGEGLLGAFGSGAGGGAGAARGWHFCFVYSEVRF